VIKKLSFSVFAGGNKSLRFRATKTFFFYFPIFFFFEGLMDLFVGPFAVGKVERASRRQMFGESPRGILG